MAFWDDFPNTNFHEINLDWFLKVANYVKSTADEINAWKATHEKEYEELLDHVDAIQRWIDGLEDGDIPEALLEGLRNIRYTWFGLTDDGYFVAYMPESWQELWFDTVMDFEDDYYGHLLIKYDANHLRKVTTYREGY